MINHEEQVFNGVKEYSERWEVGLESFQIQQITNSILKACPGVLTITDQEEMDDFLDSDAINVYVNEYVDKGFRSSWGSSTII